MLPSIVLNQATTLDLQIFDIAKSFERSVQNKAAGELPAVKEEVMLEALKKVKGE